MDRTILHCDLNNFYASVELLSHPELRDTPVAVCGDPAARHGVVLAKNEVAKRCGVQTAETIWQAKKKCPDLVLLPAHRPLYQVYSRKVNAIYNRYTDLVEPFSIDESWLDVTGSLHLFQKDGAALADALRETVRRELGLTISVGVSFNKVFAKLGSDYRKPDATTHITRENFQALLWPLPVTRMLYVGQAAGRLLERYHICTIGALADTDRAVLETLLGKQGALLWEYARGLDASPVIPASALPPPKSVGNGRTFSSDLVGLDDIRTGLELLADAVAARLRRHDLKCTSVQLTIRDTHFRTITRQAPLDTPTYLSRELTQAALGLLQSCWDVRVPIRMLTVTAQRLIPAQQAGEQLDLFCSERPAQREKWERLEQTVDNIREKYGKTAIQLGSLSHWEPNKR